MASSNAIAGPAPWVGVRLEDLVHPLVAQALHLVGGERRREQHLGEQLDRGREPIREDLDAGRHDIPAGGRRGARRRGARTPRRARSRRARSVPSDSARAASEETPASAGRLVRRTAPDGDDDAHERPTGKVHGAELRAVGESGLLERREVVGARRPRGRTRREVLAAHAVLLRRRARSGILRRPGRREVCDDHAVIGWERLRADRADILGGDREVRGRARG